MGKYPGIKMASGTLRRILDSDEQGCREGGQLGHFALGPTLLIGPKRSIYSNRTVKYSIKAVTTYILPWAHQALSAALHGDEDGEQDDISLDDNCNSIDISNESFERDEDL